MYSTTKLGHAQMDKEKRRIRPTVKTGRYIVLAAITGKLIRTPEQERKETDKKTKLVSLCKS